MFNRGKRRSPRSSLSGDGRDLLAQSEASQPENRVQEDNAPLDEQIRTRAYQLYLERGAAPDGDVRDWLRAERQFTKHHLPS